MHPFGYCFVLMKLIYYSIDIITNLSSLYYVVNLYVILYNYFIEVINVFEFILEHRYLFAGGSYENFSSNVLKF